MNKTALIRKLSMRLDIPQYLCAYHLNACLEIIAEELEKGDPITLQGFGSFNIWNQTRRMGRNPRTGESCPIMPRNSIKFRPGKLMLKRINSKEK